MLLPSNVESKMKMIIRLRPYTRIRTQHWSTTKSRNKGLNPLGECFQFQHLLSPLSPPFLRLKITLALPVKNTSKPHRQKNQTNPTKNTMVRQLLSFRAQEMYVRQTVNTKPSQKRHSVEQEGKLKCTLHGHWWIGEHGRWQWRWDWKKEKTAKPVPTTTELRGVINSYCWKGPWWTDTCLTTQL